MQLNFQSQVAGYRAKQRRRHRWYKAVSVLACMVVFCTTYALILPAITMETPRVLACPLEVHTHTEDCYAADGNLVCGRADFVVHVHDDGCYDENGALVCTLSEIEAHAHTDECYTVEKRLICELEEGAEPEETAGTVAHQHDASCYAAERGALLCGQEEDEEHAHTDACYEWVPILTCGLEESAGHAHDENCYTEETALLCGLEETAGHEHDASCYTTERGALICEDEEHAHTDACYELAAVLSCGLEEGEGAHTHIGDCYGTVRTLSCGLEEGEGAHTHTVDCYLLACGLEEGEFVPVEQPESDGDEEAVPTREKTLDAEAVSTSEKMLNAGGHVHTDACYEITRMLICDKEEIILHTHTDACCEIEYDEETGEELSRTLICGQLEILEHVHTDACFVLVEENAPAVYSYEDETIAAEVTLAEGSALPEGTELVVRPITSMTAYSLDGETDDDGYEDLVRQAEEAVGQPVTDILLYDISFYTPDGEYLPVEDSATVSLRFKEAVFPEGTGGVTVLHFQEDRDLPEVLEAVDVTRDGNDEVSAVTFETEGFSTFGIMPLADTDGNEDKTESSFTLTYNGYTITFNIVDTDGNPLSANCSDIAAEAATRYIFGAAHANTANTDKIVENIAPKIEGYTFNGATKVTGKSASNIEYKWESQIYSLGTDGYNSPVTNESVTGFRFYTSEPVELSQKLSWGYGTYTVTLTYTQNEDNLDGKSFAIVSQANGNLALTATSTTVNGVDGLTSQPVTLNGNNQVVDSATVWTFERQTDGTYYISTSVDNTSQYLYLCETLYGDSNDGRGSLTLSTTPQTITVTAQDDGTVTLTHDTSAVNLDTAENHFWCYNDTTVSSSQFLLCEIAPPDDKSSFTITYGGSTLTVNLVDWDGNPLSEELLGDVDLPDITLESDETFNFQTQVADKNTISGYTYKEAKLVEKNVTVEYVGPYQTKLRFYKDETTYWTPDEDSTVNLIYVPENSLVYDLNLPSMNSKGTGWQTEPTIDSNIQSLSDAATLYAQPKGYYSDTGPAGIANLYRFNVSYVNSLDQDETLPDSMKTSWYGEERFDGWEYTAEDGTTHLFEPEAAITRTNDGEIRVTDVDGNLVTLPEGATLTGKWTEVSNVVSMYINYTGTILDVEGDVDNRNGVFTLSAAIGHVFYGKQTVGNNNKFGTEANLEITAMFRAEFDPNDPGTQIVIECLRTCTQQPTDTQSYLTAMNLPYHGANSRKVEENTLKLLKETGRAVQLATGSGTNPAIDNSLCDKDHYEIRWYVLKEQTDTWHIDGVLVAKTSEIALTKTFSGLSTVEAQALLTDTDTAFQIKTQLGTGTSVQDYLNITADNKLLGQYEYSGSDATSSLPNSYHWTLHSITDETYTLTEENYELAGYDVSSIVVHYYTDSTGTQRIAYGYGNSTWGDEFEFPVTGGQTSAVSFNNFYTPTDTGAMAIVKRDSTTSSTDSYGLLQGAEFTLYSDEECQTVASDSSGSQLVITTNANGTAYFSGLKEDIYYLKETTAPDGYEASGNIYKVDVKKDESTGNITVTLYEPAATGNWATAGTTLYDGGIQGSFTVKNTANTSTITVVKTFSGLTTAEMDKLYQNSKAVENETPSGYYINFQGDIGASGDVEATNNSAVLTLDQAQRSQDGFTFTWTIHNLNVGTEQDPVKYTITEHNYMLSNYVDVVVTAKMTDPSSATGEMMDMPYNSDGSVWLGINRNSGTAAIYQAIFSASRSDVLSLSNHYTNTFELKLRKVDSNTGEALANAEFKIYGPYDESTNPKDNYTYTDADGTEHTVYYIKTITSGTDGYASLPGLKLSNGENTFVYILDESKAPSGYAAAQPQVVTVTVDQEAISTPGGSNYLAGVLEYSAPNTKEQDYVHAALDTVKVWNPGIPPAGATVTLELYRVTHDERNVPLADVVDAELVAQVTLDGTADDLQTAAGGEYPITAYESAPWTATWCNLYSADKDYTADNPDHYHYFVREFTTVNGYAVSYTCYDASGAEPVGAFQTLRVTEGGTTKTFQGVLIADMDEAYTATVVNTTNFELPETGGMGSLPYYAIGGALLMACGLLYGYKLRRKSERRYRR